MKNENLRVRTSFKSNSFLLFMGRVHSQFAAAGESN